MHRPYNSHVFRHCRHAKGGVPAKKLTRARVLKSPLFPGDCIFDMPLAMAEPIDIINAVFGQRR
jgi:hypothetical protein